MIDKYIWWAICILVLFLRKGNATTIIDGPFELINKTYVTTTMDFSDQDYVLDFATPLTHFDTFWCRNSCAGPDAKELTSGNYSHTIIFQDMVDEPCFNCGYCTVASWAKKLGATAILIASYETPGHEKRVIHKASECIQVKHYPALEIGDVDATEIYTAWLTHPITMTITSDENLFDTMYNSSWITMQFITLGYATVVNAFGVMKLWQLHVVKKKTGHGYLAIFVVGIQVACNLQRIVFVAVDPMWSKGYFSYAVGRFMLSVSVPISLLSVVLIIITWRQVLNNSLGGSNSIWQQPFNYLLVAFGLMFSIGDLFACYISAVYGMVAASTTSGTALVLLSWGTSITVAVYGYVLIQRMKSKFCNTVES